MLFFHYLCSVKQQINYIISQLRGYFPEEELRDLAYWIVEETTGMTRTEILMGCKDTKKNVYAQEKNSFLGHRAHFSAESLTEDSSRQADTEVAEVIPNLEIILQKLHQLLTFT